MPGQRRPPPPPLAEATKPLFDANPWDAPEPWRTDRFYFQFAYYTIHFHYDADHQQSYLFDAEYHFKETWLGGQWIAGMALFQNSFGQFSQYLFGGLVWRPIEDVPAVLRQADGGSAARLFGPVPGQGSFQQFRRRARDHSRHRLLRAKRYCGEFVLLGTNAALLTIGMTVP